VYPQQKQKEEEEDEDEDESDDIGIELPKVPVLSLRTSFGKQKGDFVPPVPS
jgi:hypothetical protein